MLNKEIAILALLGLITKTQAIQCKAEEFRYFKHSNAALKKIMSPWQNENKPTPPKPDVSDDEDKPAPPKPDESDDEDKPAPPKPDESDDEDKPAPPKPDESDDEDNENSSLPWVTQKVYPNEDCRTPLVRLLHEGEGSIKVPAGQLFEDKSFPASWGSASWAECKIAGEWARVPEKDTKPSLYGSKGIQEGAVKQGPFGDCWLLACIAALGEFPDRVSKLMNGQKSWPKNGQFTLDFHAYGKVQKVTIDDKLLFVRGHPYFAKKSNAGAWWAPIVEKASAKFYGNYHILHGGWMDEGMAALTGMPSKSTWFKTIDTTKQDALFAKIQAWDKADFIMTGATIARQFHRRGSDKKPINAYGLANGHAYTILGAQMLGTKKVLRIRNPWGRERYTGSMADSKLTDEDLKKLNHVRGDDGIFFMPMNEFSSAFELITTTFYDSWKRDDHQTSWNRKDKLATLGWKIDNPADQRAMIGLAGVQDRMFRMARRFGGSRCKASEQAEGFRFRVHNSNGVAMTDSNGEKTQVFMPRAANAAFYFDKLPKGKYTLRVHQGWVSMFSGDVPFAITTFAIDQKMSATA